MCVPVITGATVACPSSFAFAGVAFSLATSSMEEAAPTVDPSPGVEDTSRGGVLSMRMLVLTSCEVFPSESETAARRSYNPSVSVAVSKEVLQGAAESVPIGCQLFAPDGLAENATCVAPEPVTVAFSVIVPESVGPGSCSTTVGAVTSTCTVTVAPVNELPA